MSFGLNTLTSMKAPLSNSAVLSRCTAVQVLSAQGCLHKSGLLILLYPFVSDWEDQPGKFPISCYDLQGKILLLFNLSEIILACISDSFLYFYSAFA